MFDVTDAIYPRSTYVCRYSCRRHEAPSVTRAMRRARTGPAPLTAAAASRGNRPTRRLEIVRNSQQVMNSQAARRPTISAPEHDYWRSSD